MAVRTIAELSDSRANQDQLTGQALDERKGPHSIGVGGCEYESDHCTLSERTVHRHMSNIFTKLDVDSRAAAVAYGINHRIVEVGTV
jgi:hypothetical protein